MPLTLAPYIVGTHAFFFREGDAYTVPSAGTAGRELKPGAADTNWISMGVIEDSSDNLTQETLVKIYRPSPGRQRLYDVISARDELMIKLTCAEWGPFHTEVAYLTLALATGATQFNPLEGKVKKGWLKLQRYDHDDNQRLVMDVFVQLRIAGELAFGGTDIVKPQFEALVLHSTLNTATL